MTFDTRRAFIGKFSAVFFPLVLPASALSSILAHRNQIFIPPMPRGKIYHECSSLYHAQWLELVSTIGPGGDYRSEGEWNAACDAYYHNPFRRRDITAYARDIVPPPPSPGCMQFGHGYWDFGFENEEERNSR
jgi:hypothetical protein